MRHVLVAIFSFSILNSGFSQEMTAPKLLEILQKESDTLKANGNSYQF